jgi:hypothetical protein
MEFISCVRCEKTIATSFSELVRQWRYLGKFCVDYCAVTKRSETPQNMSFGSNRVDRVRSLRKIQTRLCLENLCVNGTSSASFASTFHAVTKRSKNMSFGSNGVDYVHWLRKNPTQLHLANLSFNGASSASFASTFMQ